MANEEQQLEIKINGDYKNINLKDIDNGNYVIIEKLFEDGLQKSASKGGESWNYYIMKAKYKDEEVSFFMNETQHNNFKNCGGIDDKIKVTATLTEKKQKGQYYMAFSFDLI